MSGLKPFWRYYGGKYRAAPRYPAPRFDTIVEEFAGQAGYSLRYPDRRVILVEKYHVVAEIWRFLIRARESEIRSIPYVEHVDELPDRVCQGARWLVGFCMNAAATSPRKALSSGSRGMIARGRKSEGWGEGRRERVASQVQHIRHWQVIEGDYTQAPDIEATHFIDPPYEGKAGDHYIHGSSELDYTALGTWVQSRQGQVIACEAVGATWLPFQPFMSAKAFPRPGSTTSAEAIWTNERVIISA